MRTQLLSALVFGLVASSCSSGSGGKKDSDPGATGSVCSKEPWSLALAGLVVSDRDEIGNDGSGLPPVEQTWALLSDLSGSSSLGDYSVVKQTQGRQRQLQSLTQFSFGYPQRNVSLSLTGQKPAVVDACRALSELVQGKSIVSKSGERPTIYRLFAFRHDFSKAVTGIFDKIPGLRLKDRWNLEDPLFKTGVEATPDSFVMDVTYKQNPDSLKLVQPEIVSLYRYPANLSCGQSFRVKAFLKRYTQEEITEGFYAADHCMGPQLVGDKAYYDCAKLKVEHTADACTFSVQNATIKQASGADSKVSFSGKFTVNEAISKDRAAPFYDIVVDQVRAE